MTYTKPITFDASSSVEAAAVVHAINILLTNIKDKKHLITLGTIIQKKPDLIATAIPYLKML